MVSRNIVRQLEHKLINEDWHILGEMNINF